MAEKIQLTAQDGHTLDAWRAGPRGKALGGIVIIQEIFGLTEHVQRLVDQYAEEGYLAVAPAMFDRLASDLVFDYSDVETGRAHMRRLEWPNTMKDVAAAVEAARREAHRVAVIGYCWGGTVAHVAACELDLDAAVSYYGAGVVQFLDKQPRCPIMYHFGDRDRSIPPENVEAVRSAYPGAVVHVYEGADHGFNCEDRASFDADASRLALERTLAFLREHVAV